MLYPRSPVSETQHGGDKPGTAGTGWWHEFIMPLIVSKGYTGGSGKKKHGKPPLFV